MNVFDAIVVTGGRISRDGMLHSVLRTRVEKAIELYQEGIAPRLIFSGNIGINVMATRFISEAKAMKLFAIEMGVPEKDIIIEERSRDNFENAFFTRMEHLEPNDWKNIALVANSFQSERVLYTFEKMLGSQYSIRIFEAENSLDLKPKFLEDKEKSLMDFTCNALDSLDSGNIQEIRELLCDFHPIYREEG